MKDNRAIRLYVEQKLEPGSLIELPDKTSHYLCNVMRCRTGSVISCFNPVDGEFDCRIAAADKKKTLVEVGSRKRLPERDNNLWLLFAPLKKDKTDFVIEKAVELGVVKIIPVLTARTNADKVKTERFAAQAVEAAEQCGRLSVPEIAQPVDLGSLLQSWEPGRLLFFMDERRTGTEALTAFGEAAGRPAALLVGPEGGFSDDEAAALNRHPWVKNISLGPRILRAETAAAAGLAVWQAVAGDWRRDGEK